MLMLLIQRLFRRRPRTPREEAIALVRRRLRGRVSATTLSIAEARAQRHLTHGRSPQEAAGIAIAWATGTHLPAWAEQ